MASHGSRTAGMETPTATPPASMHDCNWIWYRGSEALCLQVALVLLQPVSSLFITKHNSELTHHNSDHTRLNFPLGLESTDTAPAVTALTARARYVLHTAATLFPGISSFKRTELKLGQNTHRTTDPGEQRISQFIFYIVVAGFVTSISS